MELGADIQAAIDVGRRRAAEALERRDEAQRAREAALARRDDLIALHVTCRSGQSEKDVRENQRNSAGFLVALGDSWFDYPFHDVVKGLHHRGYDIESAARAGDRIEAMAYQGGQIDEFARCLEKVIEQGAVPRAVLLSGGGNDIVADDFGMLLNSKVSPIHGWNLEIVNGIIKRRIRLSYYSIVTAINAICLERLGDVVPVLVHGYDYPVPDGRGVGFGWLLPGPWLRPGFREKGFKKLPVNVDLMREVITRFNDMLQIFASDGTFPNVRYVKLLDVLSTDLANDAYRDWWANELHPTGQGFDAIAEKFAEAIEAL